MGGNALNFKTRRVNSDEFFILATEICDKLQELYPNAKFYCLDGGIKSKESFGDLDIIIENNENIKFSFASIKQKLNSKDYHLNSGIWSFDYKDFQVDLIFIQPEYFDSAVLYYFRGELGNFLGRLFHKFGLKFGHKGLSYIVRSQGDHPFAEILLSQDGEQICKFIGVNWLEYKRGFETLEDLFKFVSSSPYFNSEIFLFDNQNHINRTRNRKRPLFNQFIQWNELNKETLNKFIFPEDKSLWFEKIESHFPGFKNKLAEFQRQIATIEHFKAKYNGEIVSVLTDLQGQNLGKFMAFIKESEGGKDEFMKKVLDKSEEEIKLLISTHFETWKK